MTTLEERFQASHPVRAKIGRADANGVSVASPMMEEIAPDLSRLISEACWGVLWTRPALSAEQRSLITISVITALRRDDNLKGHIESGLDVGHSAERIVEIMLQLLFYVGAPIANTGLRVAYDVFKQRDIKVQPLRIYDPSEDPEDLYRRGLATQREVMGDQPVGNFDPQDEVDRDWQRYALEYLWGSVWPRSGLDLPSRCLCTLTALTVVGTDQAIGNYVRAARNLGLAEEQIKELFFHLTFYIGISQARRATAIAKEVFKSQ